MTACDLLACEVPILTADLATLAALGRDRAAELGCPSLDWEAAANRHADLSAWLAAIEGEAVEVGRLGEASEANRCRARQLADRLERLVEQARGVVKGYLEPVGDFHEPRSSGWGPVRRLRLDRIPPEPPTFLNGIPFLRLFRLPRLRL